MGRSDDAQPTPRPRRASGDGSIWQDKDGQWWASLRFQKGQRPYKSRAKDEQDAEVKLKALIVRRDAKREPPKTQTVAAWLQSWLITVVALDSKATHIRFVKQRIENHIIPCVGFIRLEDLKAEHIREMQTKLRKLKKAPRTINHDHAVLSSALDVAVEDRLILFNPAKSVKKLKVPRKKAVTPLTPSEAASILWAVQGHRLEAMYHLVFWGYRIGELLGLRVSDVDLIKGTIRIEQGAVALDGGKMAIDTPKSDNAYRTLPLTPRLLTVLRRRVELLFIERGAKDWEENGLLFPSNKGTILTQRNATRHLKETVLSTAGITRPWSWHQFRHTTVSWLTDLGISKELVKAIIGHADSDVTDRYSHVSPARFKAIREALDAMEATYLKDAHEASAGETKERQRRIGAGYKQRKEG